MEKLGGKIWWEREGWFIRKNHVVGFLLCFVTCLVFVLGALRHAGGAARGTSVRGRPHARLGYQRRLDQVSALRGRVATARAFSVTGQATGDPDALCFFVRFSRPGRVRLRFQPACVRACVCVHRYTQASNLFIPLSTTTHQLMSQLQGQQIYSGNPKIQESQNQNILESPRTNLRDPRY